MRNLTSFALLGVASLLIIPLTVINRRYVRNKYGNTAGYFYNTARNIDIWANSEFRAMWNARLITAFGYKFGRQGETISSVLGKNQLAETLTKEGWRLVRLLERFEKDHCLKWIQNFE